jgi:hypothetical protein
LAELQDGWQNCGMVGRDAGWLAELQDGWQGCRDGWLVLYVNPCDGPRDSSGEIC